MMQPQSAISSVTVQEQTQRARAIDATLWQEAWRTRSRYRPARLQCDRPLATLPISLTGESCSLNCAHCGGHYLAHMRSIDEAQPQGYTSALISGGCDPQGRVPVTHHLDRIAALHTELRLNWHVGMISAEEYQTILPYVDTISFDLIGDAETAREVYGLELDLVDYMTTFEMLRAQAPVVPHLTIGLRGGQLSGEYAVLEALQGYEDLEHLILLILIPTQGTRYATCPPPDIAQVTELFLRARLLLPHTRLTLGCMRPRGAYRVAVDELAVRAGLDGLVNPMRIAITTAQQLGLEIIEGDACCALT